MTGNDLFYRKKNEKFHNWNVFFDTDEIATCLAEITLHISREKQHNFPNH